MSENLTETKVVKQLDDLAKVKETMQEFNEESAGIIADLLLAFPVINERYKEIQQALEALSKKELELVNQISEHVISTQESVKGDKLHAVYSKGRTTWDGQKLDGYSAAHPEILQFKKVGKSFVSIREVKEVKKD